MKVMILVVCSVLCGGISHAITAPMTKEGTAKEVAPGTECKTENVNAAAKNNAEMKLGGYASECARKTGIYTSNWATATCLTMTRVTHVDTKHPMAYCTMDATCQVTATCSK